MLGYCSHSISCRDTRRICMRLVSPIFAYFSSTCFLGLTLFLQVLLKLVHPRVHHSCLVLLALILFLQALSLRRRTYTLSACFDVLNNSHRFTLIAWLQYLKFSGVVLPLAVLFGFYIRSVVSTLFIASSYSFPRYHEK